MVSRNAIPAKIFWPAFASFGLPLVLIAIEATPIGPDFVFVLIGIPLLLLAWACLGIWALVITFRRVRRRQWSHALASGILPLTILVAGLQFWNFIHLCIYCGDVVHFIAARSSYVREVRSFPQDGEPRLLVFNLGGMSWASRGYVYDETDELLLAPAHQSASWKIRADQTELTCGYFAEGFPGHSSFTTHWYIASFSC